MPSKKTVPSSRTGRPGLLGRRRLREESGASAVEFAIVLSVLLLFVFGIIQFGIAYNRDQGLKAAAREGARVASVGGTRDEISNRLKDAQSLFRRDDIKIKIDYSTDNGANYVSPALCDDTNPGTPCTGDQAPCGTAGIANLVRVRASVPPPANPDASRYAIIIPLWGNAKITFNALGVFRCENKT